MRRRFSRARCRRDFTVPISESTARAISSSDNSSYSARDQDFALQRGQGIHRRAHDIRRFAALDIKRLRQELLVFEHVPAMLVAISL